MVVSGSVKRHESEDFLNLVSGASDNQGAHQPGGKILRVKQGYNPNSSSMGSIVFALPAALLGITVVFGAVSGAIMSAFVKGNSKGDSKEEEVSDELKQEEDAMWD